MKESKRVGKVFVLVFCDEFVKKVLSPQAAKVFLWFLRFVGV